MAAATYSNVRLDRDLSGNLPTNTYKALLEGDNHLLEPAIYSERSLNGSLHVHKLLVDSSNTKVFDGRRYKLLLTRAEKEQLAEDLGEIVYFMPHYRDEGAGYASYRSIMLFRSMQDVIAVDPCETYYYATVELEEGTGQSV